MVESLFFSFSFSGVLCLLLFLLVVGKLRCKFLTFVVFSIA